MSKGVARMSIIGTHFLYITWLWQCLIKIDSELAKFVAI